MKVQQAFLADGMEFEKHPRSSESTPRVHVTYRLTKPFTYPAEKINGEVRETIERFLACANVNPALMGWDVREPVEEFDIEIENREELRGAGLTPPVKFAVTFHNTSTYERDFVLSAWASAHKLANEKDAEVLSRILLLLRHSMVEDDEYDRLSKIWRSFNAFYNYRTKNSKSPEDDRITEFAHSLSNAASNPKGWLAKIIEESWTPLSNPVHLKDQLTYVLARRNWASVTDCLIKQNFVAKGGTKHSANLATAVAAKNLLDALENALLCIYLERNKVMHGEIVSDEERDLLYVCSSFLQRIVAVSLNEFYFVPSKQSQP